MQRAPRKVLFIHPALAPYRIDLFNAIGQRCAVRVTFLMDNLPNQTLDQTALRARLNVPFEIADKALSSTGLALAKYCAEQIDLHNPDVVVTSEFGTASTAVSALRLMTGRRLAHIIWTDDNPHSVRDDGAMRRVARSLNLLRTNGLIVISEDADQLYRRTYRFSGPTANCPVIHSELTFRPILSSANQDAAKLTHRHALKNRRVILFVGRLAHEKGLDLLFSAAKPVLEKHRDALIAIVGDGPMATSLRTLVKSLGISNQVIFAGHAEGTTLMAWYQVASTFVLPSRFEPFGAVANEALLAGLPVVCSKFAGAASLIKNGTNGAIINPHDDQELAAALEWTLELANTILPNCADNLRPNLMPYQFSTIPDEILALFSRVLRQ